MSSFTELTITVSSGTEAMFSNLGHFTSVSIRVSGGSMSRAVHQFFNPLVLSLASHPSFNICQYWFRSLVCYILLFFFFVLCSLLSPFLCTHVWLYNTWARQLSYQRTLGLFPTVFTVQSQVCLLAHQFLKFTCFIYVMPTLYYFGPLCRSCFLACICYCYTCSHCWQSGCDNRHIFNNQTMPCSWMLPTCQSSP